jgi:hypothetical protein
MGKPVSVAVEPVPFSEAYYRRVIREFGYDTFDLRRFDFDLGGMRQKELNLRYLCHHHADRYLAAAQDRRAVTTGFGMVRTAPHGHRRADDEHGAAAAGR